MNRSLTSNLACVAAIQIMDLNRRCHPGFKSSSPNMSDSVKR